MTSSCCFSADKVATSSAERHHRGCQSGLLSLKPRDVNFELCDLDLQSSTFVHPEALDNRVEPSYLLFELVLATEEPMAEFGCRRGGVRVGCLVRHGRQRRWCSRRGQLGLSGPLRSIPPAQDRWILRVWIPALGDGLSHHLVTLLSVVVHARGELSRMPWRRPSVTAIPNWQDNPNSEDRAPAIKPVA